MKKPTGRKPGAQPGHEPRLRCRLPAERVQQVVDHIPKQCQKCKAALSARPGPNDPEPLSHPLAELPPIRADATEHRGHARTCPDCGSVTREPIPAEVRAHSIGPKLAATLVYLSGRHHLSKRGMEEVAETIFDVPIALGTICKREQEMSQALAAAHAEVAEAVRAAATKNVDETSWKQAGKLCWMWTAVAGTAMLFVIHAKRSVLGLTVLLGEAIQGVISSDRFSVYGKLPLDQRQICWAHLLRDLNAPLEGDTRH
jgi:transposase